MTDQTPSIDAAPIAAPTEQPTVGGGEVIIRMYSAAIRFTREAAQAITDGETGTPASLIRARSVIDELRRSLDFSVAPALCSSLDQLYEFAINELTEVERDRNPARLFGVVDVLNTLLDAWQTVVTSQKTSLRRAS